MTPKDLTLGAYRTALGTMSAVAVFFVVQASNKLDAAIVAIAKTQADIAGMVVTVEQATAVNNGQNVILEALREQQIQIALRQAVDNERLQNLEDGIP